MLKNLGDQEEVCSAVVSFPISTSLTNHLHNMGLFNKEKELSSQQAQADHREVLPQGKPRGVATENGQSFEEAGVEPSLYKEEEYDVERTYQDASIARDRGVFGSVSSGSTDDSTGSYDTGNAPATQPSIIDKMVSLDFDFIYGKRSVYEEMRLLIYLYIYVCVFVCYCGRKRTSRSH